MELLAQPEHRHRRSWTRGAAVVLGTAVLVATSLGSVASVAAQAPT